MVKIYGSIFLVSILLTACLIEINGNGYRLLKKEQRTELKPFVLAAADSARDQRTQLALVEITGADVKQCLGKYPYTWVYLWRPFCHGPHCKPLYYYERVDKAFRDKGVKFLMISETYDYDKIKANVSRSAFDCDLYVLKDAAYGHKLRPAREKFLNEIAQADSGTWQHWDSYMIFKKDSIIYHGEEMSAHIMDSVLSKN